MGQGGACNRCSDVSLNKNAPRALDETSSEEGEQEEESDEEDKENEEEEKEEAKKGAELALQDGLKRGKTATFKEAIEHATALGLDEDKIHLAEKKLEDHKTFRRREAFEAELHDFLRAEEANDITSCQDKLKQGKEYGIKSEVLKPVQDRILELELMKDLSKEEGEQVKQFLELCTRRFVASCVVKGRDLMWVDLGDGSKYKATVKMDLTLKNFTVAGPPNGDLSCKVADVTAKRAADSEEVSKNKGFKTIDDAEQQNAVAVLLPSGSGPWCFLEASKAKQDEFVVAFQVFNGLAAAPASGSGGKKGGKEKKGSPKAAAADDEEALRNAAEGEEQPEEPLSPISPRGRKSEGGRKSTGSASPKDEKKDKKKDKKEKAEEKPPPPPPPEEEENNEVEAEEEEAAEEEEE